MMQLKKTMGLWGTYFNKRRRIKMRPIKFRAWDKIEKVMINSSEIHYVNKLNNLIKEQNLN